MSVREEAFVMADDHVRLDLAVVQQALIAGLSLRIAAIQRSMYRQTGIRGVTTAAVEVGGWQRWPLGSTVGRL
jgi:hypothetical protein